MRNIALFVIVFLLLMSSSVFSQDVYSYFDHAADFLSFKTYKWVSLQSVAPIDKLTDEQIKAALDAGLARKGLTKVNSDGTADLLIGYQTSELIDEKFARFPTSDSSPWTITTGDLAIDMYTPAGHNLVWRGVASKTLDPKAKPEKRQKNLDKAIAKLMKNYPPLKEKVP